MTFPPLILPSDLASAHVALLAERTARLQAEAEAANAKARLSSIEALNAHLQLLIGKLEREKHGPRRERTQRLIDQLELQLEELVASAAEDELAAPEAAAKTQCVRAFARKRPVRKPWPHDVEREPIVIEAPRACDCCGDSRLSKLGEDVTETLEEIPRSFKVIETVREKFMRPTNAVTAVPAAEPTPIICPVRTAVTQNGLLNASSAGVHHRTSHRGADHRHPGQPSSSRTGLSNLFRRAEALSGNSHNAGRSGVRPCVEIGGLTCKSISALISTYKAPRHSAEPAAVGEHANLRDKAYFH